MSNLDILYFYAEGIDQKLILLLGKIFRFKLVADHHHMHAEGKQGKWNNAWHIIHDHTINCAKKTVSSYKKQPDKRVTREKTVETSKRKAN